MIKKLFALLLIGSSTFAASLKIMPIGHSFTLGNWTGGHRPQEMKILHDDGYLNWKYVGRLTTSHEDQDILGFDFPDSMWGHEGYSGYTALQLAGLAGAAIAANSANIFLCEAGTNDITSGAYTDSQVRDNIKTFLDTVYARKPTARIVLGNISMAYPGALMSDSGAFNASARIINPLLTTMAATYTSEGKYIEIVDQSGILRNVGDTEDGVHPEYSRYVAMAQLYAEALKRAINSFPKLLAYYPVWAQFSAMTPHHLKFPAGLNVYYIHFSGHAYSTSPHFGPRVSSSADSTDLKFGEGQTSGTNWQQALIDSVHNNGQKILLSITAQDNAMGDLTLAQKKVFAHQASEYMKLHGYDGIELDWEINLSSANVNEFLDVLRDTLNTWPIPGFIMMATLQDGFNSDSWDFYDPVTMNSLLDAYYGMNYGMQGISYLNDSQVTWGSPNHRVGFSCPYVRPLGSPWNGITNGYNYGVFKDSCLTGFTARGASLSKVGVALYAGGERLANSDANSIPGSVISPLPSVGFFPTYSSIYDDMTNYDSQTDSYWGISGGYYVSCIDSVGARRRLKWAVDTIGTNLGCVYDVYGGYFDTGARYGRQPIFDSMVLVLQEKAGVVAQSQDSATRKRLMMND